MLTGRDYKLHDRRETQSQVRMFLFRDWCQRRIKPNQYLRFRYAWQFNSFYMTLNMCRPLRHVNPSDLLNMKRKCMQKPTHLGISSKSSWIASFSWWKKLAVLIAFCFLLFSYVTAQLYKAQMNITPIKLRFSHETIHPSRAKPMYVAKCEANILACSAPTWGILMWLWCCSW